MKGTEELQRAASAYIPGETDDMTVVQKKFAKKYPEAVEMMDSFGNNQNEFNRQSAELIEELIKRCSRLEEALAAEITARKKETSQIQPIKKELDTVKLRSTLNTNQLEKIDGALARHSERTEDYILHIAPGARLKDCPKGCREAKVDMSINLPERLDAVKKAYGDERENKLSSLERVCMKAVSRELSYFNAYEEIGIDFYGSDKYAEIIYKNLCINSIYKIEYVNKSINYGRYFVC